MEGRWGKGGEKEMAEGRREGNGMARKDKGFRATEMCYTSGDKLQNLTSFFFLITGDDLVCMV